MFYANELIQIELLNKKIKDLKREDLLSPRCLILTSEKAKLENQLMQKMYNDCQIQFEKYKKSIEG